MAHQELHEPYQLRHEQHKCEDNQSEEGMTENFADDVAIQDAHETKAKCSMPPARQPKRCCR